MANLKRALSMVEAMFSSKIRTTAERASASAIEPLEYRLLLTGTISGTVYKDSNDNGSFDPIEAGIPSVTVYIDVNDTGSYVAGDPVTTTDANGNYSFSGLGDGAYVLRQEVPAGFVQTQPGSNDGVHVTIYNGDSYSGQNFGDFNPTEPHYIVGTVYNDLHNAGQLQSGDPGIAGVTVYIDVNDSHQYVAGDPVATTDAQGNFVFNNVAADPNTPYVIRQIVPTGMVQTQPTASMDGQHVTVVNASVENVNFGDFTPDGSVTAANWSEITGNAYDPGELSNQVYVQFSFSAGPTQEILANQANGGLNDGFTYVVPFLSTGTHTVTISVVNTRTGVTNLLATESITSQNSLFDENWYLQQNPDVAAAVAKGEFATGYDHYIEFGQYEGRSPSPYWNESWYLQENPDVAAAVKSGAMSSGFMHYYLFGQYEGRGGVLYFNQTYYLDNNPDVAAAVSANETTAYAQYIDWGQYEGRSPMLYFSASVYDGYTDIAPFDTGAEFTSDFEHFIEYGQFEGRIASDYYNEQIYLADNPDVAAAVAAHQYPDGFIHWLEWGQYEGRTAV